MFCILGEKEKLKEEKDEEIKKLKDKIQQVCDIKDQKYIFVLLPTAHRPTVFLPVWNSITCLSAFWLF